jgi:hypothetical protein
MIAGFKLWDKVRCHKCAAGNGRLRFSDRKFFNTGGTIRLRSEQALEHRGRTAAESQGRNSKELDAHRASGSRSEAGVACNERGAELFGEGNVGRIVGRQFMAEPPNLRQEDEVGIAG